MGTLFLSTSFIYLASAEAGCIEIDPVTGKEEIIQGCAERLYGIFRPAALVTNIATISGILVAFFLPVAGAMMDNTPHRWTVGVVTAAFMILTEVVQIGTTSNTWFGMAILEAVSGLFFQVQLLSSFAYLPDIAREVGQETMNTNISYFLVTEIGVGQLLIVIIIIGISIAFELNDVATAQVGQSVVSLVAGLGFYVGWRRLPRVPAKHFLLMDKPSVSSDNVRELEEEKEDSNLRPRTEKQRSLLFQGFVQNWNTCKHINREYKNSLRWFLLGTAFGDSAASAFLTVAIIFLTGHLGLDSTSVGLFFVVALLATVLGCRGAEFITARVGNPNNSWRLGMVYTAVIAAGGALIMTRDNAMPWTFAWGFLVGLGLGWYYQAQALYMSMVTPESQEAEIAGFFNYCRIILAWLPPLVFSILVENNIPQSIGVMVTSLFFLIAVGALSMSPSWDLVVSEAHKTLNNDNGHTTQSATLEEGYKAVNDDGGVASQAKMDGPVP
jgi:MFS transporter, UMF1 family